VQLTSTEPALHNVNFKPKLRNYCCNTRLRNSY